MTTILRGKIQQKMVSKKHPFLKISPSNEEKVIGSFEREKLKTNNFF